MFTSLALSLLLMTGAASADQQVTPDEYLTGPELMLAPDEILLECLSNCRPTPNGLREMSFKLLALRRLSPTIVDALISKGMRVDDYGPMGSQLLIEAIYAKNVPLVDSILKHGGDPNKENRFGWRPYDVAEYLDDLQLATILNGRGAAPSANAPARFGKDLVTLFRDEAAVGLFVRKKGDEVAIFRDPRGESLLSIAIRDGRKRVAEVLAPVPGVCDSKNWNGQTAIHVAAEVGLWVDAFDAPEHRSLLNVEDRGGFTPVMLAVQGGSTDVLRRLLNAGADIDHRGWVGYTALHIAILNRGSTAAAQELLSRGARWDIENDQGLTAQRLAQDHRCEEIIQLINRRIADPLR